jgi:hypothetical protein
MVRDGQVRELRKWLGREASLRFAAMKAGMDRKTARKYRHSDTLPSRRASEAPPRPYRTRPDPFSDVWSEVEELLEAGSGWEAKTLFEELQRRHPGRFADGQLRTLQRRIKEWKATRGPAKEVFFAQVHPPGQLGASDFTLMNDLGVTINGQPFRHMVYHFVLTHSNWEHVTVCFSESFESFTEGFQNAVWALGGVPERHRSDRMSLAVQASGSRFFTCRYQSLMTHYQVQPQAINVNSGHENGDCEQSHHRFKRAVKQALLLRGSADFPSQAAYEVFLREVCERRNAKRKEAHDIECRFLKPLPAWRLESFRSVRVRVQPGSTISVERNIYSVSSRLIGEWVDVRIYAATIEVWYAQRKQETMPRLSGRCKHRVHYRHVIDWLVRKPGAFAGYRYRSELFPTSRFRMAYDFLAATASDHADREYLGILHLAARQSEVEVDEALRHLFEVGDGVSLAQVEALVKEGLTPTRVLAVSIEPINLSTYDALLHHKEEWHEGRDEGMETTPAGQPEGTAPADDTRVIRLVGGTGAAGVAGLRALPAGTDRARVRRAEPQASGAVAEGFPPAAGKEPGDVRSEASTGEGAPTGAGVADGGVRGTPRERAGVRRRRLGEDAPAVRDFAGTGPPGPAGLQQPLQPAGAGPAAGQAGPPPATRAEETGQLRRGAGGRLGLRAAKPRGDGSALHLLRGTLRERERALDEQPALLEVGADFSGSDDDGGRDRPISASQRDRRIEPVQLPGRAGQERQ